MVYPVVTLGPWHTGVCSVYPGIPSPVGGKVRRSQYGQGTVTIVAWPAYELRHIRTVHIDTKIATRPSMGDCGTHTRTHRRCCSRHVENARRGTHTTPGCGLAPRRRGGHRRLGAPGGGCAGGGGALEKRPMDLGPCALGFSCASRDDFESRVLKLNLKLSMPPVRALAGWECLHCQEAPQGAHGACQPD